MTSSVLLLPTTCKSIPSSHLPSPSLPLSVLTGHSYHEVQNLQQELTLERLGHENATLKREVADQQQTIEAQKDRIERMQEYLQDLQAAEKGEEAAAAAVKPTYWQSYCRIDCLIGGVALLTCGVIAVILFLAISLAHQQTLVAEFKAAGCRGPQ